MFRNLHLKVKKGDSLKADVIGEYIEVNPVDAEQWKAEWEQSSGHRSPFHSFEKRRAVARCENQD